LPPKEKISWSPSPGTLSPGFENSVGNARHSFLWDLLSAPLGGPPLACSISARVTAVLLCMGEFRKGILYHPVEDHAARPTSGTSRPRSLSDPLTLHDPEGLLSFLPTEIRKSAGTSLPLWIWFQSPNFGGTIAQGKPKDALPSNAWLPATSGSPPSLFGFSKRIPTPGLRLFGVGTPEMGRVPVSYARWVWSSSLICWKKGRQKRTHLVEQTLLPFPKTYFQIVVTSFRKAVNELLHPSASSKPPGPQIPAGRP
jgi:hypothetical protein